MNEIDDTNLTDQAKFRFIEKNKMEIIFDQKSSQRKKKQGKRLSKKQAAFDYIVKFLIVLSATSCAVCIISFISVVVAPIGIAGTSFAIIFFNHRNKKLLSITRNKKRKHDKILVLAKSILTSIETLVS